jgi:probable HAF family extracellular repeat protein
MKGLRETCPLVQLPRVTQLHMAIAVTLAVGAGTAEAALFTYADLGTLGGTISYGMAVNASGQVAGYSFISGANVFHTFISAPDGGTLRDLGTLGGTHSYGYGINASGQVAGYSYLPNDTAQHAFISGSNGWGLRDLGTLGGTMSWGRGINASGQVAGY